MLRARFFKALLALVFLTPFLHADCTMDQDCRSRKASGVLITDLTISGTQTLSSVELAKITGKLTGFCFNEDPEELAQRIRNAFLDRGYFHVILNEVRIKPSDPLALPKSITIEAEVIEGPRFKVAGIKFEGNHVFSASKLRSEFSLRKGDLFERDKIVGGLESVRRLYASSGYVDWTAIPDTEDVRDDTILLEISIEEGPQYRMGKLEIFAKKELADRLRAEWQMPEGAIFDRTYPGKYVDANRPLLPPGFNAQDVQLVRNCGDVSVEVRLPLDGTDPRSQSAPKDIDCKPANNARNGSSEN